MKTGLTWVHVLAYLAVSTGLLWVAVSFRWMPAMVLVLAGLTVAAQQVFLLGGGMRRRPEKMRNWRLIFPFSAPFSALAWRAAARS